MAGRLASAGRASFRHAAMDRLITCSVGSVKSAACASSCCITCDFAHESGEPIGTDGSCCEFAWRFAFAQRVTAAGPAHRRCIAITRTNGEHHSWRKQPCSTERANSGCALADPDSRLAADVFCSVAPCASLCAAQHQPRFKHAVVSFPLRKTTHCRRAFR